MKRLFFLAAWSLMAVTAGAQTASTFEMRYFTPDAAADGVTDFHANRMAFQRLWAASDDVDTVYGPGDSITPVIFNLDGACHVRLEVRLQDEKGKVLETKVFKEVSVPAGRSVTRLSPFRFRSRRTGCHFIVYQVTVL